MKRILYTLRKMLPLFCLILFAHDADAQLLKNLGKRAEKAAERAVERRVEQETTKKTDEVLDSILEPGKKGKTPTDKKGNPIPRQTEPSDNNEGADVDGGNTSKTSSQSTPKSISVYSKFDFVPGDKLLFFDDFSNDFIGDFPSKWNTNSGGELVMASNSPNKWLNILPGYNSQYIPDITDLPENFTLEFDVMTNGINQKTSSQSYLEIMVADNHSFDKPKNYGMIAYSFCQFIEQGTIVENNIAGKREIRSDIKIDLRNVVLDPHHVSIAVNQQRFRMWVNEQKIVDVPRLLPTNVKMNGIKFSVRGIDTNTEAIYLSNIKVAESGIDLRRKLISEGKVSTNGILFDSGSANIQPQSMGIILQISQVLKQETNMSLKIIGHTDSDGSEDANLELSKKRAEAIKNVLTSVYAISSDRLGTEGKGESTPIGDNTTPDGKAQNRRVEFIKI